MEELAAYNGSDPQKPLLMAIKAQIYDVSQSRFFLLSALLSLLACFLKHQLSVLCLPGFFQYPPRLSSDDDAESRMVLTF